MMVDLCLPCFVCVEFVGQSYGSGNTTMSAMDGNAHPHVASWVKRRIRSMAVCYGINDMTLKRSTMEYKIILKSMKQKTYISSNANNALISGFEFFHH